MKRNTIAENDVTVAIDEQASACVNMAAEPCAAEQELRAKDPGGPVQEVPRGGRVRHPPEKRVYAAHGAVTLAG